MRNEKQDEEKVEDWNRFTKKSLKSSKKKGKIESKETKMTGEDRHLKQVGQKCSLHYRPQSKGEKRKRHSA
jgi:hypothetical protein